MSTDLVTTNSDGMTPARADLLSQSTPGDMLQQATQVANVLKDVLVKQGLVAMVSGKPHVKVEGWNTMGCMLGILSREKEVKELEDGSYEATVELYSIKTGAVVGTGSALCGKDEARWGKADRFARRSMAITRATGKAFRLNFSWVMSLAGYEPTPEEEHPAGPSNSVGSATALYMATPAQKDTIHAKLKQQGVSEDLWAEIGERLKGRPIAELKLAYEETQNAAGAFA